MTCDATFGLSYTEKYPVKTADNDSALTFSCRQNCAIFSLGNEARHFRLSIGLTRNFAVRHYKVRTKIHVLIHARVYMYICEKKCK